MGVYILRPFLPTFLGTPLHIFAFSRNATLLFSIDCALFCTVLQTRRTQLFSFQSIPHSLAKTPGGWACAERKQTGGGGGTRGGGRVRRKLSTTDSRDGQLFLGEKFFSQASRKLFITPKLGGQFLLRLHRTAFPGTV